MPTLHRIEETPDNPYRLGRHIELDPRSLLYATAETPHPIKPLEWLAPIPTLDQGQLGSCVGNAATRHLAALLGVSGIAEAALAGKTLSATDARQDEQFAVEVYHESTVADGYPGTYPPTDTGSSGLGACRALKKAGLIHSYHWATTLRAWATLMQKGGTIIGVPWYEAWFSPSNDGFVDNGNWQDSGIAGGHEVYVEAIEAWDDQDPSKAIFRVHNSWGDGWGDHGCFRMRGSTYNVIRPQTDIKQFVR
jgi:hypothetical protein